MTTVQDGDVRVGELIGKRCVTDDDVDLGTVVYLGRDARGTPKWLDVALDDETRDRHDVPHDRVRLSAGCVEAWDAETLRLGLPLDGLRSRWFPTQAETIEEPSFERPSA